MLPKNKTAKCTSYFERMSSQVPLDNIHCSHLFRVLFTSTDKNLPCVHITPLTLVFTSISFPLDQLLYDVSACRDALDLST